MEDAMKSLENKKLGFEKKNGHHYYTGWDEIYEGIIYFTNSIFIYQGRLSSHSATNGNFKSQIASVNFKIT